MANVSTFMVVYFLLVLFEYCAVGHRTFESELLSGCVLWRKTDQLGKNHVPPE